MILAYCLLLSWVITYIGLVVIYLLGWLDDASDKELSLIFLICHIACTPLVLAVYTGALVDKFGGFK